MQELLDAVGKKVKQLSSEELKFLKELLVSQGIYAQYCFEKNKEQLKKTLRGE